jgi:hypothetical protein
MSYSGFDQHICKNGHLFESDAFWDGPWETADEDKPKCPHCQEPSVWHNCVDTTNGPAEGIIEDWSLLEIEPAKFETCKCCGHTKRLAEARYRVPTRDEAKSIRRWCDD